MGNGKRYRVAFHPHQKIGLYMVNFYKNYTTDKNLEEEGIWVSISNGIEIKVCRIKSKRFSKIFEEATKPYKKYSRGNFTVPMPPKVKEEYDAAIVTAVAQGLLRDWKNIEDENDVTLPFTTGNAAKLLADDDFFAEVWEAANTKETFLQFDIEDDIKNLKKPSSGA